MVRHPFPGPHILSALCETQDVKSKVGILSSSRGGWGGALLSSGTWGAPRAQRLVWGAAPPGSQQPTCCSLEGVGLGLYGAPQGCPSPSCFQSPHDVSFLLQDRLDTTRTLPQVAQPRQCPRRGCRFHYIQWHTKGLNTNPYHPN